MQLKELDDYLDNQDIEDYELFEEQEKEYLLLLEQRAIYIPDYNIKIREGIYETWDQENQEYEVDYTFYIIFDSLTGEWLYTEAGSTICVCLYNFLSLNHQVKLSYDDVSSLICEVQSIEPLE